MSPSTSLEQNAAITQTPSVLPNKPSFMRTVMGREIAIHDPNPNQLCIFDVAHGLAMQCRYAGHVRRFYSIAEHCYWTSILVEPEFALEALLHDAAETNLNDLIQPVKGEISGYRAFLKSHAASNLCSIRRVMAM